MSKWLRTRAGSSSNHLTLQASSDCNERKNQESHSEFNWGNIQKYGTECSAFKHILSRYFSCFVLGFFLLLGGGFFVLFGGGFVLLCFVFFPLKLVLSVKFPRSPAYFTQLTPPVSHLGQTQTTSGLWPPSRLFRSMQEATSDQGTSAASPVGTHLMESLWKAVGSASLSVLPSEV